MRSPTPRWTAALGVFAAGLVYFGWRGPWRAVGRTIDFPAFYGAARAWLHGGNPYRVQVVSAVFHAGGGPAGQTVHWFLNPPASLPLLAWLGPLPYAAANLLWLGVTLVLLGWIIHEAVRWAGLDWAGPGAWALTGFVLALSPFHTSVSQGQLSIAVVACVLGALEMHRLGRPFVVGLLLAVAAALKPQMVFTFGAYYLLTGRWRVCLGGIGVLGGLMLIGVGPMAWSGTPWWSAWARELQVVSRTMNNPAAHDLSRYTILTLAVLLYSWVRQPVVVGAIRGVFLVALGGWVCWVGRRRGEADPLVIYAALAELALLGAYHRIYDASVLVLPLALGVLLWRQGRRWLGGWMLGLMAPMIVSGAAAAIKMTRSGWLPRGLTDSWLWRGVVLPHPVWLVLGVLGLTLAAMARGLGDGGDGDGGPAMALDSPQART